MNTKLLSNNIIMNIITRIMKYKKKKNKKQMLTIIRVEDLVREPVNRK